LLALLLIASSGDDDPVMPLVGLVKALAVVDWLSGFFDATLANQ
jgi:hypothetical protein